MRAEVGEPNPPDTRLERSRGRFEPPGAAAALYAFDRPDLASEWLRGLARSANQGPFGQSHFADGVLAAEAGGAPLRAVDHASA